MKHEKVKSLSLFVSDLSDFNGSGLFEKHGQFLAINVVRQVPNEELGLFRRFDEALIAGVFAVGLPTFQARFGFSEALFFFLLSPIGSLGHESYKGRAVSWCGEGERDGGVEAWKLECEGFGGGCKERGFGFGVEEWGGRREEAGLGHGEGSDRHLRTGVSEWVSEGFKTRVWIRPGDAFCCQKYHTHMGFSIWASGHSSQDLVFFFFMPKNWYFITFTHLLNQLTKTLCCWVDFKFSLWNYNNF